jgi:hypothetical protein
MKNRVKRRLFGPSDELKNVQICDLLTYKKDSWPTYANH